MGKTGQIDRVYLATPYTDGFTLEWRWRFLDDLSILDKVLDEEDVDLYPVGNDAIRDTLLVEFPEQIPEGTEFTHSVTGNPWQTEKLAYIKDFEFDNFNGVGETDADTCLVWGAKARYSYIERGDPYDKPEPEESYSPWQYPPDGKEYVPTEGWPDSLPFAYGRWVYIASEGSIMEFDGPWGLFLLPETLTAYNLIAFDTLGGGIVSDLTTWDNNEAKLPIEMLRDMLDTFGFSTRLIYSGGGRNLEVWMYPEDIYGTEGPVGFFSPYASPISPNLDNIIAPANDLLNLLDIPLDLFVGCRLSDIAQLYAKDRYTGIASDGKGIASDGKGVSTL